MEIFKNGAQWLKSDFHLHTKADKEFKYVDEENEFVKKYIEQLKKNEIKLGVITNHNKFDLDEYKTLKKKACKEEIYLMAGVELSVNDGSNGLHALIVFDYENWVKNGTNYIEQFLNSAFEGIANRENENTSCRYNLEGLLEKLEEHKKNGRDFFVIMAHIEQSKGILNEIDGGRLQKLVNKEIFINNILGFQKFRTHTNLDKFSQWFINKDLIPAFVEGSDCKNLNEVGKMGTQKEANGKDIEKTTYIKLGNFNFKAVKNAFLDKNNRLISDKKPCISNSYIKSVYIDSGTTGLLHNQTINFSPEMNNFIGIRGSGKSAVIELIRYVLGINLNSDAIDKDYKNKLIEYVLKSGAKITLKIVNEYGEEYRVEKIYGQKEDIFKENKKIEATINGILKKLPVYFGQKDLSNKDIDFEANLIRKLIGHKLEDIKIKIKEKENELKKTIIKYKGIENLDERKEEFENRKKDAEHKIQIFKDNGVEEKLKKQTNYESDIRNLKELNEKITEYKEHLNNIYSENINNFNVIALESVENNELFKKAKLIIEDIKKEFELILLSKNKIEKYNLSFSKLISELEGKKEELKGEFAQIKREINIPTLNPDEFLKLKRVIDTSILQINELEKMKTNKEELKKEIENKLYELNELWREEYKIIDNEVKRINDSNEQLKIEVTFKGEKGKFLSKNKEIFKGTGISSINYDKIIEKYADFIEIFKNDSLVKNEILNDNHYIEYKKRFDENLEDLLSYQVENKYNITYNGKPLNNHSLGQRATALILFLLAQKDTDILIIDQPEDDLDNQTIYDEVITNIRNLKGKMQFIFATHNANIPVLGDSEKIIACEYSDEKIKIENGNIDEKEIQEIIVRVMEGGEEAFSRRKKIYSLWRS